MLGLFEGYGVELEYMLVDRETLDVRPVADRIIHHVAGSYESEVERGELAWSNELVLHVIELKTNGPAKSLDNLADLFQGDVRQINEIARDVGAVLLPTGAHPWMDPFVETKLWPHEHSPIYDSFNAIFDCRGHGWSNLQSTHVNLPFANDDEFGRLHAAIRLVLPILPGLAASTPFLDGRDSSLADVRLETYRHNADKIPSVMGQVIPEAVFSQDEYHAKILQPMYRDIAPHDAKGVLQNEWLNARGAIARFDRQAIEIRVLDVQECVQADLAITALIVFALRSLCEERWCSYRDQKSWEVVPLVEIFDSAIRDSDRGVISNQAYIELFGRTGGGSCTIGELWRHLLESAAGNLGSVDASPLEVNLAKGCLAERIRKSVGGEITRPRLVEVYSELSDCLQDGRMYDGDAR